MGGYLCTMGEEAVDEEEEEDSSSQCKQSPFIFAPEVASKQKPLVDNLIFSGKLASVAYLSPNKDQRDRAAVKMLLDDGLTLPRGPVMLRECLSMLGFQLLHVIHANGDHHDFDTNGYIASNETTAVLAFRGTEAGEAGNWISDMDIEASHFNPFVDKETGDAPASEGLCSIGGLGGWHLVHRGFYLALLPVLDEIDDVLLRLFRSGKVQHLIITGHSLGGALAFLYMAYLFHGLGLGMKMHNHSFEDFTVDHLPNKISVVTFGQPQVGSDDFMNWMEDTMQPLLESGQLSRFRVVNGSDPVPDVCARIGRPYRHEDGCVAFINYAGALELEQRDDDVHEKVVKARKTQNLTETAKYHKYPAYVEKLENARRKLLEGLVPSGD